ncbi:ComEC/Rec2 family competence protein [Rummeliibacillus sp. NPDC094406]|uniref:ComEC/Rec2 family competence protein n=1 Tax=Rummeliibacillus sp. NPDC094406 TaxID=3364511 RepID=UPI00380AE0F7
MKKLNLLVIFSLLLSLFIYVSPSSAASNVKVHVIDVGQGDSILIQTGNENVLIDGGNKGKGDEVVAYLKKQKVKTLNAVVSTHPDADHVGGLAEVINSLNVKSVYAPKVTHTTQAYKNFLTAVKKEGLKIKVAKKGVEIPTKAKNITLKFLAPVKEYTKSDLNDWSGVLQLTHSKKKFLFTGDAETQAENDMLKAGVLSKVDVLKVSHHGAKEATGTSFLNKVKPTYAVISVSKTNGYGHPTAETLNRLKKAKTKVYRTDKNGNVIFTSTGSKISVKVDKN